MTLMSQIKSSDQPIRYPLNLYIWSQKHQRITNGLKYDNQNTAVKGVKQYQTG